MLLVGAGSNPPACYYLHIAAGLGEVQEAVPTQMVKVAHIQQVVGQQAQLQASFAQPEIAAELDIQELIGRRGFLVPVYPPLRHHPTPI